MMLMTDPEFNKVRAAEMFAVYPDVIDGLLAYLEKTNEETPRAGPNVDETVQRAYRFEGWGRCVDEIRSLFRNL